MRGPEMGRGSCSCWSGAGPPTRGWLAFTGDAAAAYNPLNPRLGFLGVYPSSSAAGEEEGGTGGPAPLEETPGCCAPRVSGRLHPSAPPPSASEFLPVLCLFGPFACYGGTSSASSSALSGL